MVLLVIQVMVLAVQNTNMLIDELNDKQESTLATLRERILARKAEKQSSIPSLEMSKKRELMEVSEVLTPENDNGEFSLERYGELCFRTDTLHHNYLVYLEDLKEYPDNADRQDEFERSLTLLAQSFDEVISEGIKPRF